jgi:fatty-acyl-CoA synthase
MRVPLTLRDHIDRAERVYPDRLAVIDEPDQPADPLPQQTYRELAERARAQAAGLDALGVGHGERIAIVSQNSARLLSSFFGVSAYGRVVVPVNFRLRAPEVKHIVEHSGASVLLVDPELDDELSSISAPHRFVLGVESDEALHDFDREPAPWEPEEEATASINYTSGTTARPKGVQLTHRNLWINSTVFGWQLGISDRDVLLHTLPQFHVNGWTIPYAATAMGVKQVILRKVDGGEILRRIEAHGVTLLCGAPAVVAAVLEAAADWDGPIPGAGTVRVVVAGAPPPTRIIERVGQELGWEFIQIYGLTETSPLLTMSRSRAEWDDLDPNRQAQLLSRAGHPAFGIDVRVTDDGEVVAHGNHVMDGYWQQPDATGEAIRDGWFHTGDGGRLEDDGALVIQDRKKDVIISGGENVSSIEVEDCLFSHPEVAEVAVIGVPDERWGETVKALVVRTGGATCDETSLIAHCKERLAGYKCPTSVEFREQLDRTATGKLQKFKLRQPYWEGQERQVH